MKLMLRSALVASAVLFTISVSGMAFAQKQGGILRMYTPDSPASMSIHEEATVFSQGPMMGVFNNLVMFDQHVKQNSLEVDRAGSGDRLVMERGRNRADLPTAARCEMA